MKYTAPDVRRARQIDAAWMENVLQRSGLDCRIDGVRSRPVGTGQTGECVRFDIAYAAGSGPASMIGKFPSSDPVSFQAGITGGDYTREVRFYRDLAATTGVSAPKCYLAEMDDASGEFVLLLEDLAPARQGDQLTGVTLEQARLVVDQAARLHAAFWDDPVVLDMDWIKQTPRSMTKLPPAEVVLSACEGFTQRYAECLSKEAITACWRYAEGVDRFRALPRKCRTIAHYDFRPDNMMFASADGGRPVTILDWQTLSYAAGADDLAYFLAGALPSDVLARHEPQLLNQYLSAIQALGVRGYSMADLQLDYAIGAFRLLATGMGGAMAVVRTPRGDQMFTQMVNAAARHLFAHGALDLLD